MKTETKILGAMLVLSLALILGAVFFLGKSGKDQNLDKAQVYTIDYSKGEKIGSSSAKVKLVEFSDLQCPACKAVEPVVKQVREKYKDIQFIYIHFPLMQHAHSKKAANFAQYAATQGKFWEIHDKLFATQDEWSNLSDPSDYFANLGVGFLLDKAKIKEAIAKGIYDQLINDDLAEGKRVGVDATPSFYINGKKINLINYNDLDKAVSEELGKGK